MITRMLGSGLDICAAVSDLTYITSRRPDALEWEADGLHPRLTALL